MLQVLFSSGTHMIFIVGFDQLNADRRGTILYEGDSDSIIYRWLK